MRLDFVEAALRQHKVTGADFRGILSQGEKRALAAAKAYAAGLSKSFVGGAPAREVATANDGLTRSIVDDDLE